ncbi:hypothetical protein [Hymenobacter chitinivorans]|uniref:Uncharacterized protein n=1 Tax=Hymenobacter chitinivorans DSM 11115 TaxID=1121954 RepID=A0A2M9BRL0_9BACT|nr:hypothetical protein [Hymenobacter chitinivorans]PJJ60532.1 hypothetical protein CLV45_1961 [Hymenobacter chitinivorans DSM 11115]
MIEVDLVAKHGKKALGLEEHGHHSPTWRQRLPEILLEIGIIVFAITLSIQLHSWHEHSLERQKERKFLLGLRQDLSHDIKEMQEDSASYVVQQKAFSYFRALTPQTLSADSLKKYSWTLRNTTVLVPNASRFEGLKSSGDLDIIEDEALLNGILDHYQELIPGLVNEADSFSDYKGQTISRYLDEHLAPNQQNLVAVMGAGPMQNYLSHASIIPGIVKEYHHVMQHSRHLIHQIDSQLGGH